MRNSLLKDIIFLNLKFNNIYSNVIKIYTFNVYLYIYLTYTLLYLYHIIFLHNLIINFNI